jgi:cell division protein FtsQ
MKQWQNILIKTLWSIAGAALIFLFVIAWKAKVSKKVSQIQVELVGETTKALFMDENEITQILKDQGITKGTIVESINLTSIEQELEKIRWIKNAELFINNQQLLEVKIQQRIPIARVFTVAGNSFYIDDQGWRLPLKQLTVLRLPVFTGFPTDQDKLSAPDSLLLKEVLFFSNTIKSDSFFTAQIAQVNIGPNGDFQMVPSLGDHTVLIGSVDHLADKLNRLYTFYKKVWVQSGINAYQVLDCRFDGQIVALKKGLEPIQYAAGMMPFQNSGFANTENVILNTDTASAPIIKDTLKKVAPIAVKKGVKVVENKVAKKPAGKGATIKKSSPAKIKKQINPQNNKQNNKSLINKKKSAKALMPTKTNSKNNNN